MAKIELTPKELELMERHINGTINEKTLSIEDGEILDRLCEMSTDLMISEGRIDDVDDDNYDIIGWLYKEYKKQ